MSDQVPTYNCPSSESVNKLFDYAIAKRPPTWGHSSCAPYYKEFYARNIKEAIDKQLENRQDIVYRYSVFCGRDEELCSRTTLYNRVNQSIRFLLEHLDTNDKKYLNWKKIVRIERIAGLGVRISMIREFRNPQSNFTPDFVLPKEEQPLWQRKMEDWLESGETKPFVMEKLALTEERVKELYVELNRLKGIAAQVTSTSIKIVRTN